MSEKVSIITDERINQSIFFVRGQKVILDEELARLYQVRTKALVQAVKRNIQRFPEDFMFQLTNEEHSILRSQIVTSSGKTGRRTAPYAFTEHGISMLSSVLNSERAIHVNISIIRAFIQLRKMVVGNDQLSRRLDILEKKYDSQFKVVFNSIRELINVKRKEPPSVPSKKGKLGFGQD